MATVRSFVSTALTPAVVIALAGECDGLQGFGGSVPPLASFTVETSGGVPAGAQHLHAALVWGEQWLTEALCVLPPDPSPAPCTGCAAPADVIKAGCRDPFGFVPELVAANVAVEPGQPATIDLFSLPGADVMVGFPGETDADFEESRRFIEALPFTYLHVFTYSERPGTPAADSAGQVPMPVRKERNRVLRELAAAKNLAFRVLMVGRTLAAVTLHETGTALTGNYLKVELAELRTPNLLIHLRIGGVTDTGLREAANP
jgi:hypothetical protein